MLGCITGLQSWHPRQHSQEAVVRLCLAAGSPQGSAPVGSGRENWGCYLISQR